MNKSYPIAHNISLLNSYVAYSSISYTINSDGSLTVGGTVDNSTQEGTLWIRFALTPPSGKYVTMSYNAKNINNAKLQPPNMHGTKTISYTDISNNGAVRTFNIQEGGSLVYFQVQPLGTSSNETFSITFYNCCLYEGEFKNPPATTSLDVKSGNQFSLITSENCSHNYNTGFITKLSNNQTYGNNITESGYLEYSLNHSSVPSSGHMRIDLFYTYLNYLWKSISGHLNICICNTGTYDNAIYTYYDADFSMYRYSNSSPYIALAKSINKGASLKINSGSTKEPVINLAEVFLNSSSYESALRLDVTNLNSDASSTYYFLIHYMIIKNEYIATGTHRSKYDWISMNS